MKRLIAIHHKRRSCSSCWAACLLFCEREQIRNEVNFSFSQGLSLRYIFCKLHFESEDIFVFRGNAESHLGLRSSLKVQIFLERTSRPRCKCCDTVLCLLSGESVPNTCPLFQVHSNSISALFISARQLHRCRCLSLLTGF